mmetsp:Transcript_4341/g.12773  ORF Transcript_4341/g.12773 Transcript_4341/m.12773 type:complete len:241 (+) Transcript_4341:98-820(+)
MATTCWPRALAPRTSPATWFISSLVSRASTKTASHPRSKKASTLHRASSMLSARFASVLPITTGRDPISSLVSVAIFKRATHSSLETTSFLSSTWPQLFGLTWSSSRMPAIPARAYPSTALRTFKTFPYPLSASTIKHSSFVASFMALDSSSISLYVMSCASGAPNRDADVVNPETKATSKPALSISLALSASWQHGQARASDDSCRSLLSLLLGDMASSPEERARARMPARTEGRIFMW